MIVSVKIEKGQKPTPEQIEEIREAAKRDPVPDEDAPELSLEQMERYREAAQKKREKHPITLELSKADLKKAKAIGKEYRSVLSDLLSLAMKDPALMRKVGR